MKIRLGYVSNSSSSSFVICGVDITSREMLVKAYEVAGVKLTNEEHEAIMDGVDTYEMPEFPMFEMKTSEWDNDIMLGVMNDPECFNVSECVNGFVDDEQYEMLKKISTAIGSPICVQGGTEYC